MEITIKGFKYTPTWETLQKAIREMSDEKATLVQIGRRDRHCGYRDPGEYQIAVSFPREDHGKDIHYLTLKLEH